MVSYIAEDHRLAQSIRSQNGGMAYSGDATTSSPQAVPVLASTQAAEPVAVAQKPARELSAEEKKAELAREKRLSRAIKDADKLLENIGMGINKSGEGQSR